MFLFPFISIFIARIPPKRMPGTKKVKPYKAEAERKCWQRVNETAEEQKELQSAHEIDCRAVEKKLSSKRTGMTSLDTCII